MSEHIQQTIADLQSKVREHEAAANKFKSMVNQLCEMAGMPTIYNVESIGADGAIPLSIQSDQFYGQPLASCMRTVLEMRRALKQGPATVNDLFDALRQGGFAFETKNEDNAKRNLRISLTKNTALFHKLPNGMFGLLEWYPNAKTSSRRRGEPLGESDAEANEEVADEDAAGTDIDDRTEQVGGST